MTGAANPHKEEIIRRKLNGESSGKIARALGIGRNAVIGVWDRYQKNLATGKIPRPDLKKARPRKTRGASRFGLAGSWGPINPPPKRNKKPAKIRAGEDAARACKFSNLGAGACQFEIHDNGEIAAQDFRFCAGTADHKKPPYCERHFQIAFDKIYPPEAKA